MESGVMDAQILGARPPHPMKCNPRASLLYACLEANLSLRGLGEIIQWVHKVGDAGYFRDHGMLPSSDSLRVNVLPGIINERMGNLRRWVRYYASQGKKQVQCGRRSETRWLRHRRFPAVEVFPGVYNMKCGD